jgi:hypothetical protein
MSGWHGAETSTLRRAVASPTALVPLMQAHPDRAAELILAALLREPGSRDWTSLRRDFGIVDRIGPDGSLPECGPMLAFFIQEPDVALATLMRIVEHATAGWAKSEMADVDDEDIRAPFEILVDGQWVALSGNANVMHWHRGDSRVPQPLACALMGLEQFLYRKLDAGEDLHDIVGVLLTSRSVAIFGVLVETACYQPVLLRGTLAPLATSAALILADRLYKRRDHAYLRMAFTSSERRRLEAWHNMPHRLKTLDGEIMRLAVAEEVLVDELASARNGWAKGPDNRWRFLVAQMDPANYTPVNLESGAQTWMFEMPAELQREIDGDQAELQARQWWLTAPSQLAGWVQASTQAADNDAQNLWDHVQQRLTEPTPTDIFDDGVLRRADVECGTAAALLVCARQWVDDRPEVTAFCREALIKPFKDPPPTHVLDSGDEIVEWSWDGFAATAVPLLWERDPQDTELRQCAARLATHPHRNTVRRFFLALEQLPALNDDLRRLELLSLHMARYSSWVHERHHREEGAQYWPEGSPRAEDLPDVETPTREAFEAFVSGSLSIDAPPLEQFIAETPAGLVPQRAKPIYRIASSVDMSYLLAARAHLLSLPDGLDDEERERRLDLAAQFSSLFAETHVPGERSRVPTEEESTLNTLLATMTVCAEPEPARRIWAPILATGSSAHYWVSDFINDIWRAALAEEPVPADFSLRVKEMMAFAAEQETWTGSRTDELELALLCLSRFGHPRMVERHRQLLAELQPEWTELAARQMVSNYSACYIVDFLADPVAADIVATGLEWLAERERQGARPDDALDKSTADLLAKLNGNDPQIFQKQAAAADALAALVARQNPIALQLSAQLGRTG